MSEVNHRGNGKKYDKRLTERKGCGEVLVDDGTWIPECDITHLRRIQRRKARHQKIDFDEDFWMNGDI